MDATFYDTTCFCFWYFLLLLLPLPKLLRGKEWIWGNTAMWERKKEEKKKDNKNYYCYYYSWDVLDFFSLSCRGFREEDGVVGGREGGVWRTEIKMGLVGRQRRVEDGRMDVQAFKVPVGLIGVKRNRAASMMKALRGSKPGLQRPLRTHRVTRRPSLRCYCSQHRKRLTSPPPPPPPAPCWLLETFVF